MEKAAGGRGLSRSNYAFDAYWRCINVFWLVMAGQCKIRRNKFSEGMRNEEVLWGRQRRRST
jgi:hypothetical protein